MNNPAIYWLRALRPAQWLKNAVLPAVYFFALFDPAQRERITGIKPLLLEILAIAIFCIVSSGVYLINDIRDIALDRAHPIKRFRPLASGDLQVSPVRVAASTLLLAGIALSCLLPPMFTLVVIAYIVMQFGYTFFLKRLSYVDIFVIALGFVLRAMAGAAALMVRVSPWLLLCTFLLALFLALSKRRHERVLLESISEGGSYRPALAGYDCQLLDMQIVVVAAATLVCYSIYTLSEDTIARFGTDRLGLTIPFVVFGVFRYMELVYRHDKGGRPEKVLLTDKTLIVTIASYLITALLVFLFA